MNDTSRSYDVIVLGAGPVGENVAERTCAAGLSTLVVESELAGGECSYWACMPSKALLRPVAALADARGLAGARQAATGHIEAPAVLDRRDSFTSHWKDDGQVSWIESTGADLLRGRARLDGPRRVAVETADGSTKTFTARHAVAVCTGSRAVLPDLPGIADVRPWTSREATSAQVVPPRLAVVGGGVVGCEMAAAWAGLGAEVTLLARGDRLLPRMEPFAGELVADGLAAAGADVRTGTSATAVRRDPPEGPATVTLDDGSELAAEEVLFATGRAPRTAEVGLETVGLRPGSWLETDDSLRVAGVDGGWLYAVGDVNHRALVTHQGKYQARIAGAAIAARAGDPGTDPAGAAEPWGAYTATADDAAVPQVVFTHPEVASVGLTAAEAARRGGPARTVDFDLGSVAGAALYADGYRGRARIVLDPERGVLLGATFAGAGVGELLHSATTAVVGQVPLDRLWHAVPAYPTISEVWLRLLETYRDSGGEPAAAG